MGTETAPPPEQCGTTAKTSEWERAGHEKRGAGGLPPRLFPSGLSLEKAWIPRPGPGGEPPRGSNLRRSQTGPPARGSPVLRTLGVGGSEAALGAQRPVAPPARRGSPFLPRNGKKRAGAAPLDRGVQGPLTPVRSFWGSLSLIRQRGDFLRFIKPIWDAFSKKICCKAFLRKKVSKSGHVHGSRNSPTTGTMRHNRQNERVETSGP